MRTTTQNGRPLKDHTRKNFSANKAWRERKRLANTQKKEERRG